MGQAQPFYSEPAKTIDHLSNLRRLLADLESGDATLVKGGIDAAPTYTLLLRMQIQHLEAVIEG